MVTGNPTPASDQDDFGVVALTRAELVDAVAASYGLTGATAARRLGGAINYVVHMTTDSGDVVVRVHRRETTPQRLLAVHRVQEHLRAAGLPIPAVLRSRNGASWVVIDRRLVEVLEFVPGGHEVEAWRDGTVLFAELGRLHAALRSLDASTVPPPPFACYSPSHTALALAASTEAGFRAEAGHPDYPRASDIRGTTTTLIHRLAAARADYEGELERVLVHGDFVGYNVLIEDDRAIAILDFDRLSEGDRILDVARSLMYVLSRCGAWNTTGLSNSQLDATADLVDTYVEASGWRLTPAEFAALPFEMAGAPIHPIVTAGAERGQGVLETLIHGQHIPLAEWLAGNASTFGDYLSNRAAGSTAAARGPVESAAQQGSDVFDVRRRSPRV